ncbi:single-stranded DNA-binding protein [Hymenobacter lutimineralis]|uniref:Single-stranded DNA-binding protein n=1 Tax=Hymenobacter lutimineralis TaxID=2606448 RepID=A0A5D6UU57_9BACT|nr:MULTISPECIES: single-stranded DNA-binding protein [Hymenobacter]QIX62059.1 single-stranded DNA-binding protein [Hymenobacter sp. BT18]TYZ07023.1 single-stranded DNA-binding protein [Hymenobacter lutimineralis]
MAGINKVILIGNLGKDPEVRHLEGGASVAHFTLATNDYYKDKQGNRVERTEWHNITAWRGLADMAEKYLKKGQQVYIEGKLRTRQYQDKDNQTRYITEIVADEITMLSARPSGTDGPSAPEQATAAPVTFRQEPELDQLPF